MEPAVGVAAIAKRISGAVLVFRSNCTLTFAWVVSCLTSLGPEIMLLRDLLKFFPAVAY